jgi:hypothetical protein
MLREVECMSINSLSWEIDHSNAIGQDSMKRVIERRQREVEIDLEEK